MVDIFIENLKSVTGLNITLWKWKILKWYYDENHIFSIEAILRRKQVACMRRKMMFTTFKYVFLFQRYSSF